MASASTDGRMTVDGGRWTVSAFWIWSLEDRMGGGGISRHFHLMSSPQYRQTFLPAMHFGRCLLPLVVVVVAAVAVLHSYS